MGVYRRSALKQDPGDADPAVTRANGYGASVFVHAGP